MHTRLLWLLFCLGDALAAKPVEPDDPDNVAIDRAFRYLCRKEWLVYCERSEDGRMVTMQGSFGKVLFAHLKNERRSTALLYRSCSVSPSDNRPVPKLICTGKELIRPRMEEWVRVAVKMPFRSRMQLDNVADEDNAWFREQRMQRALGKIGLTPMLIDVMRYSNNEIVRHKAVPSDALVMEHIEGIPLPKFFSETLAAIHTDSPEEIVWYRLRNATRAMLLYVEFVRRVWAKGVRHCDIHWGNVLIKQGTFRHVGLVSESAMQMFIHSGIVALPEDVDVFKRKVDHKLPYWLSDASHLIGLDVSFAVQLPEPLRSGHACLAYRRRLEDICEIYRSLRGHAVPLARRATLPMQDSDALVTVRRWTDQVLRVVNQKDVMACTTRVERLFKTMPDNLKDEDAVDWVQSQDGCTEAMEEKARSVIEAGLLNILAKLDANIPKKAAAADHMASLFLRSPWVEPKTRRLMFNVTSDFSASKITE